MKKNSSTSSNQFGPQLSKTKQIVLNKRTKKLIHYDCQNIYGDTDYMDDDIPDESEVYIKENLLLMKKEDKDR
jgi:hypothetical protein